MNPIEWLKLAYETFGAEHPKASLAVVTVLGAIIFAGVWRFAAVQYNKDQVKQQNVPAVPATATISTTTNTTSGPNSPITTGSGNNVDYEGSSPQKKDATKPKKGNGP